MGSASVGGAALADACILHVWVYVSSRLTSAVGRQLRHSQRESQTADSQVRLAKGGAGGGVGRCFTEKDVLELQQQQQHYGQCTCSCV
jgi:hypothetical protein